MMAGGLPALTGRELAKLLVADGWEPVKIGKHGVGYFKDFPSGRRVTVIPTKKHKSLPPGTLHAILGPMQTNLGRRGLMRLLTKR